MLLQVPNRVPLDELRSTCPVLLALLAAGLTGCARTTVPSGKVPGAIRGLGYDVRFRDVRTPADAEYLVGGRLRDRRTGTALDFALMIGGDPNEMPIVPGASPDSGEGCAEAWIVTTNYAAGRGSAERDRLSDMATRLDNTIFALAPGATCEG